MLGLNRISPLTNSHLFNQLIAEFRNNVSMASVTYRANGQMEVVGDVGSINLISVEQKVLGVYTKVGIHYVDRNGEVTYDEFLLEDTFSPGGEQIISFRKIMPVPQEGADI